MTDLSKQAYQAFVDAHPDLAAAAQTEPLQKALLAFLRILFNNFDLAMEGERVPYTTRRSVLETAFTGAPNAARRETMDRMNAAPIDTATIEAALGIPPGSLRPHEHPL